VSQADLFNPWARLSVRRERNHDRAHILGSRQEDGDVAVYSSQTAPPSRAACSPTGYSQRHPELATAVSQHHQRRAHDPSSCLTTAALTMLIGMRARA